MLYLVKLLQEFPNNAKVQRPIAPNRVGVSSPQIQTVRIGGVCLSDGASPMLLAYSIMEL